MKTDIRETITASIIARLEQGTCPWCRPWDAEHAAGRINRPLRHDGTPYRGINVIVLWMTTEAKGYAAPLWLTFRQALELGGHVRAGEKGTQVVYCDRMTKGKDTDDEWSVFSTRAYTVFNAEQTEGLPERFYAMQAEPLDPMTRDRQAEAFIAGTGAKIGHGGNRAFYAMQDDRIQLPPFQAFRDPVAYYTTALHELAHWTGAAHRLDRELKGRQHRDRYAFEELVAELSSCFTAAELDLMPEPREDHASYLAHWLEILKSDKAAIFKAAAQAQKATDYLIGLQAGRGIAAA